MVNHTYKNVIRRNSIRCATNVRCDVCGKDCIIEPVDNDENDDIKYLGVVHAFKVKHSLYYDEDLHDSIYLDKTHCCSVKCVLDLFNRRWHGEKTLLEVNNEIEIHNCTYYIVEENETMDNAKTEAANLIKDIAKISPEYGNAIMDIIGEEAYERVMKLANKEEN